MKSVSPRGVRGQRSEIRGQKSEASLCGLCDSVFNYITHRTPAKKTEVFMISRPCIAREGNKHRVKHARWRTSEHEKVDL
jgi:hypothetical protein